MKVFSYRNLNRKGVVWSVIDKSTGLVVDRATTVYFSNVELKVSAAGRKRVLAEKRKNVHAGVQGTRLKTHPKNQNWIRVSYNPYKTDQFVDESGNKIYTARYAKLTKNGLYVSV